MIEVSDVEGLLSSYAAAWAANDSHLIGEHWDKSDPQPFYKAEEIPQYFHRHSDIEAYWRNNERAHAAIQLRFTDVEIKRLSPAEVLAFTHMRWDIRFADSTQAEGPAAQHAGKAMGGENHVVALVRQSANGLKLVGWNETPDAPISYVRRLYEWAADPALKD